MGALVRSHSLRLLRRLRQRERRLRLGRCGRGPRDVVRPLVSRVALAECESDPEEVEEEGGVR